MLKPPRIKKAGAGRPSAIPQVPIGRPYVITLEAEAVYLRHRREGQSVEDASNLAGIGPSTMFKYLKEGRESESGYFRELLERDSRARSEYRASLVVKVHEKSETARDVMAILERVDRVNWGPPKQSMEIEGELKGGGTTIIQIVSPLQPIPKPTDKPLTLEERRLKMLGGGKEQAG